MRFFNILAKCLALTGSIVMGMTVTAIAQERDIYWGLSLGPHFVFDNGAGDDEVTFDTGVAGALQVGYLFDRHRADLEFSYSRADVDKIADARADADLQVFKASVNINFECVVPLGWLGVNCVDAKHYVGAGLGVAHQILNDALDDEETGLTLHGEFGFSFPSSRYIDLIAAYRVEFFEAKLDGIDERPYAHMIRVGTRFYY